MQKTSKSRGRKFSLLSLCLLFSSLFLSAKGPMQDLSKTIIPFEIRHASLKQAFKKIETQTHLSFTFKTGDVLRYADISYSSPGISVEKLLNDLLADTDLGYQQLDNNIIIKKNKPGSDSIQPLDRDLSVLNFEGGIHGRITNSKGEPVAGASIAIEGQNKGVAANINGEFSIPGLKAGSYQIRISAVGYETVSQVIVVSDNKTADLSLQLKESTSDLNDVVVTALGIKRSVRSLGYSSQEVSGKELTEAHQNNFLNSLQGRVAGLTISSAGGGPGQGVSVVIRGVNSLNPGKSNEPLYVVDGIPVDNGSSTMTLGTTGGRGVQMSNRVSDINPEDIESVNILRGGAATALYGLRGANGVIVITTKSAKAGKLVVNYNASYSIDQGDKFPEVQGTYTQGYSGEYDTTSFWPTWGPTIADAKAIDPTHPDQLFDQYKHAYVNGNQFRNTLSLTGGNDKASLSGSISYFNQNGVLPFTYYKNISSRLSGRWIFSDQVSAGADVIFTHTNGNFYDADRFNEEMSYWAPRYDVRDYIKPDGTPNEYPAYNGNAWYKAKTNQFISDVYHTISSGYATYKPLSWFTATYRFGVDQFTDDRSATAPGPQGIPGEIIDEDNGYGFVGKYNINNRSVNSNLLLTFDHSWGKFQTTLRLGNDLLDQQTTTTSTRGDTLDVYNFFNLANAKKITTATNSLTQYRIVGLYGELALNYDNFLYLSITGRNDWTSTLEADNRSFFYSSVSLGYIFTQQFKNLPSWFTYGKFRTSLAGIGKDAAPYSTSTVYIPMPNDPVNPTGPVNGVIQWTLDNRGGVSTLKPEYTTTFELGTDLSFFNNRLGLNFTWYKSRSQDQIIPVRTTPSSGFTSLTLNSGEIENNGIEVTLNAKPVVTNDFSWNLGLNFSHNTNEVISLYEGLSEIIVGSQFGYSRSSVTMKYIPGESVGDIFGTPISRYYAKPDTDPLHVNKSLPALIGSNGFPVLEPATNQKVLGNAYPKWVAGIANTITYKSFSLYFLFDGHFDVQKFDQLNNFMAAFGIAKYTENRNQTIVFPGVLADGTPNTKPVYLGQGTGPDGVDYGNGYYRNVYRGVSEHFVEDASFIKLRTVSLTYNLNPKWLEKTFIRAASVGFTGINLWMHTNYLGFDPESSSSQANSNLNGLAGFTYPALKSYMFNLNVTF
jgi:TonB-linked SusC/RagA family outer membrane protein